VKLQRKIRLALERLEDRLTPASFDVVQHGASLTITQTAALAGATDTLNVTDNVTPNMIVLTDAGAGGNTTNVDTTGIKDVTLKLLPNTVTGTTRAVTYDLGPTGRSGTLKLNLGSGDQNLDINDHGGTGGVFHDLKINAGTGNDAITAAATGTLSVADSVYIGLGSGTKNVVLGNVKIGDDLTIIGKTATTAISLGAGTNQAFTVGRNVEIRTGTGTNTLTLGLPGVGTATIGRNLDASGETGFTLNPGSSVGRNVYLNAGTNAMTYTFAAGSTVNGDVSISNKGQTPLLASSSLQFNGSIGDDLYIKLGNAAGDTVSVGGSVGDDMSVKAGNNGKTILLRPTASVGGDFKATLGNALTGTNIVSITGGAKVGGNVKIKMGNATTAGGNMVDLSGAKIGGSVEVNAGAGGDTYLSSNATSKTGATSIGGSVDIDFGNGNNSATISGSVGGHKISVDSGNGNDAVLIDAASFAEIHVAFSSAPTGTTKNVTLGVLPKSAYINFGKGGGTKTLTLTGTATPVTYPLTVKNK
jgi:large repetitive protein